MEWFKTILLYIWLLLNRYCVRHGNGPNCASCKTERRMRESTRYWERIQRRADRRERLRQLAIKLHNQRYGAEKTQ